MSQPQLVQHNRLPAFIWVFTVLWWALLVAMTAELVLDGPPAGYPASTMALILGVFWIAGFGLVAYAAAKPCTSVTFDGRASVTFRRRFPFRLERVTYPLADVSAARLVESTDDEGMPYFYARVAAPGDAPFDIAEGHSREYCERVCERFNAVVGGGAGVAPGGE